MWAFSGKEAAVFSPWGLTKGTSEAGVTGVMPVGMISRPFLRDQRSLA